MGRANNIINSRPGFDPRMVPEVAAGYFWLASQATGLGTAGFTVPEGNGNTTFDLVQATVASQPTALSENGGAQFRMRNAADSNPSILRTAGNIAAGWTGSTTVAGWFRLPNASGAVTGNGALFQHNATGAGNARLNLSITAASGVLLNVSADGSTIVNNTYANAGVFDGANWIWVVASLDAAGVDNATRGLLSANLTAQTRAGGTGTIPASLFGATVPISVACRGQNALANVDVTDVANVYYCNGIPSLFNLDRLRRHLAPAAVS